MITKLSIVLNILIISWATSCGIASHYAKSRPRDLSASLAHPTADISSSQHQPALSAYSRGSLILPANNEAQLAQAAQNNQVPPQHGLVTNKAVNLHEWSHGVAELDLIETKQPPSRTVPTVGLDLAMRQANIDEHLYRAPEATSQVDRWSAKKSLNEQSKNSTETVNANQIHQRVEVGVVTSNSGEFHTTQGPSGGTSATTSAAQPELSNQVIYEGPATVPPANDYYFTASSGLGLSWKSEFGESNKAGRSSNNWW